jgi:multimeric flavodoxin WrbA
MKKVTAFIASARKGATFWAVQELAENLEAYPEIDIEYVFLKDYDLAFCNGCKLCFDKGEENCPLKDDRDILLGKMEQSDGVIFATPNYSFQIAARMKNLLDRLAFIFHRPRFFGKASMPVVTQGIFGGGAILKYLNNMGLNFGFNVAKGCCLRTLEPETERQKKKNSARLKKASMRFYRELMRPLPKSPSLFWMMMFRMSRTSIKLMLDEQYKDYRYYKEKGWFESGYYDDVSLGPLKRLAGVLSDLLGRNMAGR